MPYRQSLKRFSDQSWNAFVAEFHEVHDQSLMEGVVAGCAVVAYAEGWVTEEERRRMLGLIRGFEPISVFGMDDVLSYFEELSIRFADDHDAAESEALAIVARLRGRKRYPELLVGACCSIAAADGGFDAEERAGAARICHALALNPADFDLADAR
jgi:tellurite resistance protein TerB